MAAMVAMAARWISAQRPAAAANAGLSPWGTSLTQTVAITMPWSFFSVQFSASHRCAVVMSQIGKAKRDGVEWGRGYNRISTLDTDTDTDTSEASIDLCHSQVTRKGAVEMVM